jgi:hypothetical protein
VVLNIVSRIIIRVRQFYFKTFQWLIPIIKMFRAIGEAEMGLLYIYNRY